MKKEPSELVVRRMMTVPHNTSKDHLLRQPASTRTSNSSPKQQSNGNPPNSVLGPAKYWGPSLEALRCRLKLKCHAFFQLSTVPLRRSFAFFSNAFLTVFVLTSSQTGGIGNGLQRENTQNR